MEQLTNATRKLITSLRTASGRRENGLFTVEGHRAISEMIEATECEGLYCTSKWWDTAPDDFKALIHRCNKGRGVRIASITAHDMERISSMSTPQGVLAVMKIPKHQLSLTELSKTLSIALDCIQDPGNMGTIIRLCDWFGVKDIVASGDTVDCYNPKVVQSAMGALARVRVHYVEDLADFVRTMDKLTSGNVISTDLRGENIYDFPLPTAGVIVMGNEGRGVSEKVGREISRHVKIPSYPSDATHVESLNVAMATGIVLAEARRPRK